jgi:hypothetical protein
VKGDKSRVVAPMKGSQRKGEDVNKTMKEKQK